MKRSIKILSASVLIAFCLSEVRAQTVTLKYVNDMSDIANPERGWYEDYQNFGNYLTGSYAPVDSVELRHGREERNITLDLRMFYLHQFLNQSSVSADYIAKMQADFNAARKAGVKYIVRFAYSDSQSASVYDASPEIVMSHIASLGQVLKDNSDVIAVVQAGFIGAWGEWYYTKNFAGTSYVPDATDQLNRRLLVESLLSYLPPNIQVQVRTPAIKKNIVQTDQPISDAEGWNGTIISRVAHHNDCFLANRSDYGTYTDLNADLAYMAQDTKFAISGGETCDASNLYSDCVNGIPRMKLLHWTYLNREYNQKVYDKWEKQGCMEEATRCLGYRICLDSVSIEPSATAGQDLPLKLWITNRGYAAPTQYKPLKFVFTKAEGTESYILPYTGTGSDIRFWQPGAVEIEGRVSIPAEMPDGNYSLSLWLPDQSENLQSFPAFSIRLTNAGMWNSSKGYNELGFMISVGQAGSAQLPAAPSSPMATTFSADQLDLSWTDNSVNETGFEVWRYFGYSEEWEMIASLPAHTAAFSDAGLLPASPYTYMIRAINQYGTSPWTELITAKTESNNTGKVNENGFRMYPNPTRDGNLVISVPGNSLSLISISDINGSQLYSVSHQGPEFVLKGLSFAPGMYFVNIRSKGSSVCRKLIIR